MHWCFTAPATHETRNAKPCQLLSPNTVCFTCQSSRKPKSKSLTSQTNTSSNSDTAKQSNLPTNIVVTSLKTSSPSKQTAKSSKKHKPSDSATDEKKKPGKKKKIAQHGGLKSIYDKVIPWSTTQSENIMRFQLKNSRDSQLE